MINRNSIKTDIVAAFKSEMNNQTDDREGAIDNISDKIAAAIEKAIKSADIVYISGLVAPNGPVTGTFSGNLT